MDLGSKGKVFMVYLVRQTENLISDGGDTMKLIAKVFKWVFKRWVKKKQPDIKIIAVNSQIINIHKD